MLKRNINVYRRANQRLKEIKRQKSAAISTRRGETPNLKDSIHSTQNQSVIMHGESQIMVDIETTGINTFLKTNEKKNPLNLF